MESDSEPRRCGFPARLDASRAVARSRDRNGGEHRLPPRRAGWPTGRSWSRWMTGFWGFASPMGRTSTARSSRTSAEVHGLSDEDLSAQGDRLTIRGRLAGLELEQAFTLPAGRPMMEERIRPPQRHVRIDALANFQAGFQRPIADRSGRLLRSSPVIAGLRCRSSSSRFRSRVRLQPRS